MVKVIDEVKLKKLAFKGEVEDFKKILSEVQSDDEAAVSKIASSFTEIKELLRNIDEDLKDYNGDNVGVQREVVKNMGMIIQAVSEMNKPVNQETKEWTTVTATVRRDKLGRTKTITFKKI